MIKLKNVSFKYATQYVLDGLNLDIEPGDRIGLLGDNGSGKTTLCHIIMGLLTPESGDVEIFGKKRTKESDFEEIRGKIGFLFQDSDDQLFCPTVIEDVAFGPLNMGQSPDEAKRTVTSTLQLLKLSGFEDRITYKLSGGEKRLVSLATVLAMKPDFLILDEPTTGLDVQTTERLVEFLRESNLGYMIISHDRDFIKMTVDKLIEMKAGQIQAADLNSLEM
ncbi:MAG: energy-coupling factor ABC transporter ATP-binding protein [Deltaproteobacteria bacterium]|nr:energy-coupling factor ABC transporter ATP-binding protein [Deltaproteobacteria bacterium]